jgi:hypothetical protein
MEACLSYQCNIKYNQSVQSIKQNETIATINGTVEQIRNVGKQTPNTQGFVSDEIDI